MKFERSYTFSCEKWLSMYKGEREVSYRLNAVIGNNAKKTTYEITVVTGKLISQHPHWFVVDLYKLCFIIVKSFDECCLAKGHILLNQGRKSG